MFSSFKNYQKEIVSFVLLIFFSILLMYMGAADILDTKIFYTGSESAEFFKNLTKEGIQNYKRVALVDLLLFIPAYTTFLYFFTEKFLPKKYVFVSFLPGVFDVVETLSIFLYLTNVLEVFPSWMGYVTFIKWLTAYALAIMVGANLYKKIRANI